MTDLNLKSFDQLYPIMIRKYQTLVTDPNASVIDKINDIITGLNATGKLTNDVVQNWNTVMNWVMNDGLTTDVNNKMEDMLSNGKFNSLITTILSTKANQSDLNNAVANITANTNAIASNALKMGDLTQLNTTDKTSLVNAVKEVKTQANNNLNTISSLGNGSPKGVYATLSALQTAYPTGTNGIYVVTADGNWYYWNGTAWVSGGVYQATAIANGSIGTTQMTTNSANAINTVNAVISPTSIFNTLENAFVRTSVDTNTPTLTGFMTDPSNVSETYDAQSDTITITTNGVVGTLQEFVIGNNDLQTILSSGGFTFSSLVTPIGLASGNLNVIVYSVNNTSVTNIFSQTIVSPPVSNTPYTIENYVVSSLIPANAQALRIYLNQGTPLASGTVKVSNFYVCKGDTRGKGNPATLKVSAKPKFTSYLGIDTINTNVTGNTTNINTMLPQLQSGALTLSQLYSATMTFNLVNGVVKSVAKLGSYTGSHGFVYFPTSFNQITWQHTRADDWIALGGDDTHVTALAVGSPWSIRLIDLATTNGTAVDITINDKANVGDFINLSWTGTNIVAQKNKNDGNGYVAWFTVDLSQYNALQNYKLNKRFGAVTPIFPQDMMTNVNSSPVGSVSLIDRVSNLEKGGVSAWSGKKWNVVGDSITQTGKYIPLVTGSLGLTSVNDGLASSTIAVNNSYLVNKSVYERVVGVNGNVAYGDADLWTIFAGVNDWLYTSPIGSISSMDTTTFYGALRSTVENILGRTNSPKLILFTPLQSNRNGANSVGITMQVYRQAIKDVGDYYSIPVLDLYGIGGINPLNLSTMTSDGVHPTDAGTNLYYQKIISAIKAL